jgi:hypothetical protein
MLPIVMLAHVVEDSGRREIPKEEGAIALVPSSTISAAACFEVVVHLGRSATTTSWDVESRVGLEVVVHAACTMTTTSVLAVMLCGGGGFCFRCY